MLRIVFYGRCERECVLLSQTVAGCDFNNAEFATRQGAGLVKEHGCYVARLLKSATVAHEKPAASP